MANPEKPFKLDMSFDEALKRFAQTDPKEIAEPKKATKQSDRRHRVNRRRTSKTLDSETKR